MASNKRPFSDEDFTCPVCCDVFKEPVLLSCGHSACDRCVHRYWDIKGCRECPLCRKRSARNPTVNLALKNLCQTFLELRGDPETLCDLHGEKLKLFCVNDRQVACLVCRNSSKHLQHRFIPVDEAASQFKHAATRGLNKLNLKTKSLEEVHFHCHQNVDHIKAEYITNQINEKIQELVQFLIEENAAMLKKLEEEMQEKLQTLENKMKNVRQRIKATSSIVRVIKKDLQAEDVIFLKHNLKKYLPKTQNRNSNPSVTSGKAPNVANKLDPKMASKEVLDVAKYLGNLQFRVWNKMQTTIKYTPVVLDPNTAHSQLVLSSDLTSMRDIDDDYEDKADMPRPPVLDTPEQFRSLCVLGSEGFSSGLHCWDIEVGNNTFWMLGVTTETVPRKEPNVYPKGTCSIGYDGENLCVRSPLGVYTPLPLAAKPKVVRIRLDMDFGEVWFLDPASNTVLHMFSHHFTEKVFPIFHSMCSLSPLKIMPLRCYVLLGNIP
ncbi:zinc-binding protein A33-like isoform X2 [Neoarius graeffei]|uniref:zinc-binding protein A33-like isoform X2 n=1 Tax=Neoarius graeffei TaxID=443677 RepID=UPI00298CCCB8|nr:zinc-binding protein A33-like isoform X2 [Neoarius graeffei]